jgi:hypothetical protein
MEESSHWCTKDKHYSKSITESYRTVSSTIELKRNALFTSIWKCIILSFGENGRKSTWTCCWALYEVLLLSGGMLAPIEKWKTNAELHG